MYLKEERHFVLRLMGLRGPAPTGVPDFTPIVSVVLQTFAVLVGLSITDFLDDSKNRLPTELQLPLLFALIALDLRYIVGSAVHLNYVYGNNNPAVPGPPRSTSVTLFLKDLGFLVVFGWLAVRISHAEDLDGFLLRSVWFVGAGWLWSVIDLILRRRSRVARREMPFSAAWFLLDGAQLLLLLWAGYIQQTAPEYEGCLATVVAGGNIVFMALDIGAMIRSRRFT